MTTRYNRPAIALHWLMAVGLLATFALGLYMHDLPLSPSKLQLYSWHKWAGVSLFLVVVFRLFWRLTHRVPELPAHMSTAAQRFAHLGHWGLYGLMLAIPISGWLMSSAQGFPVVWFGIWQLPELVGKNAELGERFQDLHVILNYTLLYHHFAKRDGVLARMLPFLG